MITLEGSTFDGGISLVCESDGWLPEPVIEWLDSKGGLLTTQQPEKTKGPNGVGVKQRLVAYQSDTNSYVCRLRQRGNKGTFYEKEVLKEATLYISGSLICHKEYA